MSIEVKQPKQVKGTIINANYIPQIRCIMITLRDEKTQKILKPIALYEESFKFKPEHDIDKELEELTEIFIKMKHPITINYDESVADVQLT